MQYISFIALLCVRRTQVFMGGAAHMCGTGPLLACKEKNLSYISVDNHCIIVFITVLK